MLICILKLKHGSSNVRLAHVIDLKCKWPLLTRAHIEMRVALADPRFGLETRMTSSVVGSSC